MSPRAPPPGPITLAHQRTAWVVGQLSLAIVRRERTTEQLRAWAESLRAAADHLDREAEL